MQIEHLIGKSDMPLYVTELARLGACPQLMKAACYDTPKGHVLCYETEGFKALKTVLSEPAAYCFSRLLSMLRKVAEGAARLGEYLVPFECVSLALDDIYFEQNGRVRFLIGYGKPDVCVSFCGLCEEIYEKFPYTNADMILKKLIPANSESLIGLDDILRMLSLWELELKN